MLRKWDQVEPLAKAMFNIWVEIRVWGATMGCPSSKGMSNSPYVWVDATYHKVRVDGHITSQATVVAIGVTTEGERQILRIDVGPSEVAPSGRPCYAVS
jgi:hypothetical protein